MGVLGCLIDGIFVEFGGRVFRRTVGMPMGAGCVPLLVGLFLCSCGAGFVRGLLQAGRGRLA